MPDYNPNWNEHSFTGLFSLSNFAWANLEVTRTGSNNKLHFTWGCSILMILTFFLKYFNCNHILPSYSLFSKCFSGFLYLAVHRGTGVFSRFFFHSSSRTWLALALVSPLPPFDRKMLKNCACSADPGLLNETKGSWFPLSCLSSYQNGWWKQTFFHYHINIQKRRFFSDLVESKSCII